MIEEKFIFTNNLKKTLGIIAIVGFILTVIGIIIVAFSGGHAEHGHAEEAGHAFHWSQRLWTNLWVNNVYFTGIAIIGVFFVAINYAAKSGWHVILQRIPEAFGQWLPIAGLLMLVVFIFASHDLFHWTHETTDPIILGKKPYLNTTFFIIRLVLYFVLWYMMYRLIRKNSLDEDIYSGIEYWKRARKYSAIFLVIFAITSSTASWDWMLSTDPHWFSTIFGWYLFGSWFVIGLVAITFFVVLLRENGYMSILTDSHYHDLGKYIFAFSIFWTYLWFSQYFLIYYANIPEETLYYYERLHSGIYTPLFYANLILNFVFPFLVLMTRDSKRYGIFLKIVGVVLLIGHWIDMYLMVAPSTIGENGGLGFMELGTFMIYGAAFVFVSLNALSKASLVPKNHPMLEESLHYST